jgi:tRNA(Ile)-lysidine synthase
MSLLTRFRKSLLEKGCTLDGNRILVAVSGGADSVALLALLHSVADEFSLDLEVAHLDHALRKESPLDVSFVSHLCSEYGLKLTRKRIDVSAIAKAQKGNLEEVAREVRRDFLTETAKHNGCDYVALGHHLNDQVETLLMRLIRGSGTKGLSGMSCRDGQVLRPLLPFKRSEIIEYLHAEGLSWREDESNQNLDFMRNRVRSQLVPMLESFNPNVASQVASLAVQLQQDEEFWDGYVNELLAHCMSEDEEGCRLDRLQLVEMDVAVSGRVVRAVLKKVRGNLRSLTATHIEDVLKLAQSDAPQGELTLPGAWVARRYDALLFRQSVPVAPASVEITIDTPGVYSVPGGNLHVTWEERPVGGDKLAAEFSLPSSSFPLLLRSPSPGDRLQPSGMQGSKKLQDLFVDLKMTREERLASLIVCKNDDVLWVVGVRRSSLFLPNSTEPVLRFVFVPE